MAPTVPSLMLIAVLALAGAARAQDMRAAPSPPAAPGPMSIEDILNQSTDLEPSEAPPPPAADVGLTAEQLDLRIRGASAAAQGLQGPMDGTWTLQTDDGAGLYTFLFVDQPGPAATLEGAWRDLRRGEGLSGTGLIANVERTGGLLQASFYPKGGVETAAISLIQNSDGAWSGQLMQGGITTAVRMIRNEPMLNATPLRYAGAGVVSPYRSPAANTRVAPAPKKKVVAKKRVVKKKVVAKKAPTKKAPVKAAAKPPVAKKKA